MSLPWTKFQDFYLRLGFLKVLVAVLDKERTSAANELITRRLLSPLFDAAESHPDLWARVVPRPSWSKRRPGRDVGTTSTSRIDSRPTVAEAMIVDGECPSLLFAVTKPTAYKILDWGRNVGLLGRGNQVTERGLLLRYLLPRDAVAAFLSGKSLEWNPFVLSTREKVFFFFHLCDIDRVTPEVVRELGVHDERAPLELRDAGRVVCRTLFRVLDEAERTVRASDLPTFRIARDLATTMADEMEMPELLDAHGLSRAKLRPGSRALSAAAHHSQRKTTKNTDHQTVPRFEQLADLGFVRKRGVGFEREEDPQRRWQWAPTMSARRWRESAGNQTVDTKFLWCGFATAARQSISGAVATEVASSRGTERVARMTFEAYRVVRRTVGHTPLDSVALFAMVEAVALGVDLEMQDVHDLMLMLKRTSAVPEHAQFAGGNGLDEMFIRLREGFVDAVHDSVVNGGLPGDIPRETGTPPRSRPTGSR